MKEYNLDPNICDRQCEGIPGNTNNEGIKNYKFRISVTNILHELGIQSNTKGYMYLREAIILSAISQYAIPMTKSLYPSIAKMFDTSAAAVERVIRHTIEVAWDKGDIKSNVFGYAVINFKKKPKNSEFITTIADCLKLYCL